MPSEEKPDAVKPSRLQRSARPVRAAVLRGLAVVMPPLLTILIFVWALGLIRQYVYDPFYGLIRDGIVWATADIRYPEELPPEERGERNPSIEGVRYQKLQHGDKTVYVPVSVYNTVKEDPEVETLPTTGTEVYRRYVESTKLQPRKAIPLFICGFILVLYLLGKFMAAKAGRFFYGFFERGITRVPFVRKVYSSVKQVSDFLLSDRQVEYSRVVAVEWPRKGIWSLALVTGSSFDDIRAAANEDVLSVLIPTSPMPMTGFTVTVRKSETIDLDITIDQAVQYIVSCGVVVPPGRVEQMRAAQERPAALIAASKTPQSE
jgi:uncharacterized membrane protein